MNLFTKSLSLLFWFSPSFCALPEVESPVENTKLDFLKNEDLKTFKLTEVEIKEAFHLNDDLGQEHKQFVIDFLKTFLERQKIKTLSLWILKNIVEEIQKNNGFVKFLERSVITSLFENYEGIEESRRQLRLIYCFIFQFTPTNDEQFFLNFDKFLVTVQSSGNQLGKTSGTSEPTFNQKNSATNIENKVLSSSLKDDVSTGLKPNEDRKNNVIVNLKNIMKAVDEDLLKVDDKLPNRDVGNIEPLNEKELNQISDIFKKTILSKKFSINKDRKKVIKNLI